MYCLLLYRKSKFKAGYKLSKPLTNIGRHISNDIVLTSKNASRYHACMLRTRTGEELRTQFQLIDGNSLSAPSRNGTFVNGKRISQHYLNSKDIIHCGDKSEQLLFLSIEPGQFRKLIQNSASRADQQKTITDQRSELAAPAHEEIQFSQLTTDDLIKLGAPEKFLDYIQNE